VTLPLPLLLLLLLLFGISRRRRRRVHNYLSSDDVTNTTWLHSLPLPSPRGIVVMAVVSKSPNQAADK